MMIFKKAIARRTFLRGASATLALPFLDAMVPAFAGPTNPAVKPALRLGFVYVPNGIVMEHWTPTKEGAILDLAPTMEALTPFRKQMLVLSGLNLNPANPLPGEAGAAHTRGSAAYLTGVHPKPSDGSDMRAGVSVDQIAAREMGKKTQLASLELALDPVEAAGYCEATFACAYMNTLSWRTPTTPMPMEDKPRAVFERLFGDAETTDRASRLSLAKENHSLLDDISEEVAKLEKGLGAPDRNKLGEYLDAVRDVERRIQLAEEQASREVPTLERPAGAFPAKYDDYAKLMLDLQLLAYQTDMTRVSTFMFAHERSSRGYPEIGVPDGHHPLSHSQGRSRGDREAGEIECLPREAIRLLSREIASGAGRRWLSAGSLGNRIWLCHERWQLAYSRKSPRTPGRRRRQD